jgi:FixJ family two-component response regulator
VGKRVVLLDDDDDLRDSVADLLRILCGKECVGVRSVADLIEQRAVALTADLAILDVNLGEGEPSGIDAYEWLLRERFDGRIVFLTGHARSHPLVERASHLGQARIFGKPIETRDLRALVEGQDL